MQDLRNWIATLGDIKHRVPFGIVIESSFTHDGLLASKLEKKTSTNLGAISYSVTGHFDGYLVAPKPRKRPGWIKIPILN